MSSRGIELGCERATTSPDRAECLADGQQVDGSQEPSDRHWGVTATNARPSHREAHQGQRARRSEWALPECGDESRRSGRPRRIRESRA